jgi:purine-nucleoside phosphorylase
MNTIIPPTGFELSETAAAAKTMTPSFLTFEDFEHAADSIRKRTHILPTLAIILGSGMGAVADAVDSPAAVSYSEIPGWPVSTVEGHAGKLVTGVLAGREVAVLQGRAHIYEGYSAGQVAFPVRVLRRLGVTTLIVTNAAGAINPDFAPGDLMFLVDHINLMGFGGESPLRGPNDDRLGPRFPDLNPAYDPGLRKLAARTASDAGLPAREGVYVCVAGPSFETSAELRFLRQIGADAVGMSTVPEVIAARHDGMRVLGISVVSNRANLDGATPASHAEVLAATGRAAPNLRLFLTNLLSQPGFA